MPKQLFHHLANHLLTQNKNKTPFDGIKTPFEKIKTPKEFRRTAFQKILSAFYFCSILFDRKVDGEIWFLNGISIF